jgi:xanthine/CO dehydrogenase XdhC/CoxF family maturation factor
MANALYNPFKDQLLSNATAIDMDADTIVAVLADAADYTFSSAHDELSGGARDVPLAAIVATSGTLTSPTTTNGVFDTADFSWTAVSGDQSEDIILADNTVTNGRLIAFYDTGMTGMPVTPNGGNINVTVNASGWFAL